MANGEVIKRDGLTKALTHTQDWAHWEGFCRARRLVSDIVRELDQAGDHNQAEWLHETVWRRMCAAEDGTSPSQRGAKS